MPADKEFWDAYSTLRAKFCQRVEEVALGIDVSAHTVRSWDLTASGSSDTLHARSPGPSNRRRLARLAEEKGAPKKVVAALRPEPEIEARA